LEQLLLDGPEQVLAVLMLRGGGDLLERVTKEMGVSKSDVYRKLQRDGKK
jgi:hypothetical protein